MTRKLTQKQETFTQNLFEGMYQRDAYIDAYQPNYALSTIDANASRLAHNEKVLARLTVLRQKAEDATVATVLERKQRLTEISRARLTDYVTCGPDRDLVNVGPESPNTGALQEVTSRTEVDKDGAGAAVVTKIKLHNPIQAIDLLNKMDGAYAPEKHEHLGLILTGELTDAQLIAIANNGDKPRHGGNGTPEEAPGS